MTPLENKEIRGMSYKNLLALIIATVSICTTVLISYSSLKAQIVKTQANQDNAQVAYNADQKYTELRLTVMERTLTLIQMQIDNLKK